MKSPDNVVIWLPQISQKSFLSAPKRLNTYPFMVFNTLKENKAKRVSLHILGLERNVYPISL